LSRPSLSPDFWRYQRALPGRGRIGIFNRSHYEEVLVVRVHPELLAAERMPSAGRHIWERRYREINDWAGWPSIAALTSASVVTWLRSR
jgi:polyphosphate kinase 2 (PPK2 family)